MSHLIGKKIGTFQDKETKKEIVYYRLYFVFDDSKIDGQGCEVQNVKEEIFKKAQVGKYYKLIWNRFSKVEDIELED